MTIYGALVGAFKSVTPFRLAKGALEYAGPLLPFILGSAIARHDAAWSRFCRGLLVLVWGSIAVAALQQFGLLDNASILPRLDTRRGIFTYTTGPFRTETVFSGFLASMFLPLSSAFSARFRDSRPGGGTAFVFLTLGMVAASVLCAKRSGLGILLAAVLPMVLLWLKRSRGALIVATLAIMAVVPFLRPSGESERLMLAKVEHARAIIDEQRFFAGLIARERDVARLTMEGAGVGAHTSVTWNTMDAQRAHRFVQRVPMIHFGWYVDLLHLGVLGTVLHAGWWAGLLFHAYGMARRRSDASRYSGLLHLLTLCYVYYMVAVPWVIGVSNSLFVGLGLGLYLARGEPHGSQSRCS